MTKQKSGVKLRNIEGIVLAGGTLTGLAVYGGARYLVDQLTRLRPLASGETYTFTPFETQVDFEEVSFPTANSRMLTGWWLPRPETSQVVVAVSGYRGHKEDMLGISSIMWRAGLNVLMFDYRGHGVGRNPDEIITLGHKELEDMQAAIRYVKSRISRPSLGLLGGSMGAAVCLVATAREKDVRAVWADSGFTSQHEVISHIWRQTTHLPGRPVLDLAARLFQARTGHHWRDFSPLAEIGSIAPRPVYIVHAANDKMVPVDQAYKLYEAAGEPKELWVEEGLEHCGVYFAYRAEYARRVLNFFGQYLSEQARPENENTRANQPVNETEARVQV